MDLASALTLLEQLKTLYTELLPVALIGEPVREATAAGAGALLSTPENARQAYLIVDVGAGTTDVAGFLSVNNPNWDQARVFEISTAATAMNKAGNMLDQILHKYILDKSSLTQDTTEYRSASLDIRRRPRRALQDGFFAEGRLVVLLPTDEAVEVKLCSLPQSASDAGLFEDAPRPDSEIGRDRCRSRFAKSSWWQLEAAVESFVRKLAEEGVQLNKRHIEFDLVEAMPTTLAETNPELSDAFPQVAVAFGGSLPELPEQRSSVPTGSSVSETPYRTYVRPNDRRRHHDV